MSGLSGNNIVDASDYFPDNGLAAILPFISNGNARLIMVLSAYFDESERPESDAPICVGGFLFKVDGYLKFRRKWKRDVLRDGAVGAFHMTDLCAGQGTYVGMTIADRVAILDGAVDAIRKHSYAGLGVQIPRDEFARVAPPNWPQFRGSVYTACCHMCVQSAAYWLRQWNYAGTVLYVFEQGHKYQKEANAALTAIGQNPKARQDFRYANHVFETKAEYGVQAADLFAWTMTKAHVADGRVSPALRPFVPALLRLGQGKERMKVNVFTGDKLKRFIHEQMVGAEGIPVNFGPRKANFK